ncbi:MAG: hypothetical protein K8S99_15425 [Planctomycetes bacterium]|nr:hypothetical protein [Planctomycetota bacterium]
MKTISSIAIALVFASSCLAVSAPAAAGESPLPSRGAEAAGAITKVTGVAISPLLGAGVLGAWEYFHASGDQKEKLPWYARPAFWVPALLVVGCLAAKDLAGTAFPAGWKKPIDVVETMENKLSGLIAAGALVPIVASVWHSASAASGAAAPHAGIPGLAMVSPAFIDFSPVLNLLTIPFAVAAFVLVWLVSHVITVLILVSPFGVVDGALKAMRTAVLSLLTMIHFINPWVGAALSFAIIIVAYFIAGWSFRMMVFGSVFCWDFVTLRRLRFKPTANANWMFTARRIEKTPIRTYGKLIRGENGRLDFEYRPWLFLKQQTVTLPPGAYAVGRGFFYPEIMLAEGEKETTMLLLPPRYKGHESDLAHAYNTTDIRDVGLLRGFKAVWNWMKCLCGFGIKPVGEPVSA